MLSAALMMLMSVLLNGSAGLWTTAPAAPLDEPTKLEAGEGSCVFAFYSDPHGDSGYHRDTINTMIALLDEPELTEAKRPIQLVVSGGDSVDGTRNCEGCDGWSDWINATYPLYVGRDIPIYGAEGNHDFDFRIANGWSQGIREDWPRPSRVECGTDTALYIMPWDIGERTIRRVNDWLDEETRRWLILILHQPLYPCRERRANDSRARLYRQLFEPIIGQFAHVFAGNDHVMCERIFGVEGSGVRSQSIVTTGPKFYDCAPDLVFPGENSGDTNYCIEDTPGFLIVWTTDDGVKTQWVPTGAVEMTPGTNPGPPRESD